MSPESLPGHPEPSKQDIDIDLFRRLPAWAQQAIIDRKAETLARLLRAGPDRGSVR